MYQFSVCCSVNTTIKSKNILIILKVPSSLSAIPPPPLASYNHRSSKFFKIWKEKKVRETVRIKGRLKSDEISQLLEFQVIRLSKISRQGKKNESGLSGRDSHLLSHVTFLLSNSHFLVSHFLSHHQPQAHPLFIFIG